MSDATGPNKPCPFCGGTGQEYVEDDYAPPNADRILCLGCGSQGPRVDQPGSPPGPEREKAAWAAWNRRLGDRCAGGCEEGDFTPWLGIDPAGPPT